MEWLESILAHRLSHGSAAFAGAGAAGGGDGGAGEQPAAPPLARRPSSVARAVPQETVHMRRVSQLASVAGLAEGPLLAAAGEADIALEDARLHTRHADWSASSLKPPTPPSLGSATAEHPCFLGLGSGRWRAALWRRARAAESTVRRRMEARALTYVIVPYHVSARHLPRASTRPLGLGFGLGSR